MTAYKILVLVALCAAVVIKANDVIPSPIRFKRQDYGRYLGGNYGGYPYSSGGALPYSVNPYTYGYPYSGGNYGGAAPFSNNYPYGTDLGYNTIGGAYPYSSGYSGYPYSSGYYGSDGQYY